MVKTGDAIRESFLKFFESKGTYQGGEFIADSQR